VIRVYRDKEVIYSPEQSADAIFYIKNGIVKLTVGDKRRRKHAVVAILAKGAFFGEGCLLRIRAVRMSTATSIGSSTVVRVKKAVFWARLKREPALMALLIRHLVSQVVLLRMDVADHRLNSGASQRRLARILLAYSRIAQTSTTGTSLHPLSQTTLAGMVGTTRTRLNHFMNKFRKQGYVRYNGELEINAERLVAFLQG
jgi:CRP-like cAMP-binding protein